MNRHEMLPLSGRQIDPEYLEMLGKQAAHVSDTGGIGMTDAVVQTIGHIKLNAEQVQRVVEFANTEIFNRKFASTEGTLRFVHIDGGPADHVQVMQTLNDAARPREVVVDSLEYSMPPDFVKKSSPITFDVRPERTRTGTMGEVYALQSKLSSAHDELVQGLEAAKMRMSDTFLELAEQVKSSSAGGASPAEIFEAWHRVHPEAAQIVYPKLSSLMRPENEKVAGRFINPSSKIVTLFTEFVANSKSAEAHEHARRDVEIQLGKVSEWILSHGGHQ